VRLRTDAARRKGAAVGAAEHVEPSQHARGPTPAPIRSRPGASVWMCVATSTARMPAASSKPPGSLRLRIPSKPLSAQAVEGSSGVKLSYWGGPASSSRPRRAPYQQDRRLPARLGSGRRLACGQPLGWALDRSEGGG
jgi:hypothetical protein